MFTPDQLDLEILAYIKKYHETRGYAPSFREVGEAVGLKSSASVYFRLEKLQKHGYLTYVPKTPHSIRLLPRSEDPEEVRAYAGTETD